MESGRRYRVEYSGNFVKPIDEERRSVEGFKGMIRFFSAEAISGEVLRDFLADNLKEGDGRDVEDLRIDFIGPDFQNDQCDRGEE